MQGAPRKNPCNTPFPKHTHPQTTTALRRGHLQPRACKLFAAPWATPPGCPQMVFSESPLDAPRSCFAIQLPAPVPPPNSKRGCQRGMRSFPQSWDGAPRGRFGSAGEGFKDSGENLWISFYLLFFARFGARVLSSKTPPPKKKRMGCSKQQTASSRLRSRKPEKRWWWGEMFCLVCKGGGGEKNLKSGVEKSG